jgi:hypothetical protein
MVEAAVVASRGKTVRAELVASYYEQQRTSDVGSFATLQDKMAHLVWASTVPPLDFRPTVASHTCAADQSWRAKSFPTAMPTKGAAKSESAPIA